MYYLKLTLEGVLQSYGGAENIWRTRKDTQIAPTKSAMIGLIGCAMGLRPDDLKFQKLSNLDYLYRENQDYTLMDDYQIIRPKEANKTHKESYFWSPSGSHKGVQVPLIKEYLLNASFTVYVGCDDKDILKQIHQAFRDPVWVYYLGRACCTPAVPIVEKEFTTSEIEDLEDGLCICFA